MFFFSSSPDQIYWDHNGDTKTRIHPSAAHEGTSIPRHHKRHTRLENCRTWSCVQVSRALTNMYNYCISTFSRGGLRPGDVLTHVNGKVVNSVQQIYEALETNEKLIIRAVRSGHPMEVQITPEDA